MRTSMLQMAELLAILLPFFAGAYGSALPAVAYHAGRRCLLGSSYVLPKDASESQRLDAQHHLMELVLGALYLAPIHAPRRILDIGAGTGIWCRALAALFPRAEVVGLDYDTRLLTPTGPRRNLRWVQANALDPLPFISNSFDLVHLRFAATFIPQRKWPGVVSEMARVCRPGGYVELTEGEMPTSQSAAYQALCQTFSLLLQQRGLVNAITHALVPLLQTAGLEHIQSRTFPIGATPEEQHLLFETTRQGFAHALPILKQQLEPEMVERYQAHLAEVEATTPTVRRNDVVVYGQKPL